jgi:hypothetical protein
MGEQTEDVEFAAEEQGDDNIYGPGSAPRRTRRVVKLCNVNPAERREEGAPAISTSSLRKELSRPLSGVDGVLH